MRNKRGQIYIISAIIIILILVGLAGITNKSSYSEEPTKFYELGQQLSTESFVLAAYGELKGDTTPEEVINNFTQGAFSTYVQSTGAEFIVIYGNKSRVIYTECNYSGGVGGSTVSGVQTSYGKGNLNCAEPTTMSSPETLTSVHFKGQEYPLNFGQNQEYYYIFTKTEGSDTRVYTG